MYNDPDVINLARAIRQKESNNNPNAVSSITKSEGSRGAYQFLPATFNGYANKYLSGKDLNGGKLDINNPDHQNLVAYKYIEDKKKQGYGVDQIAASWNAGEGAINDFKNRKGVNKFGNKYDVPAYANSVVHLYNQYKQNGNNPDFKPTDYDPKINSPEAQAADQNVLGQLQRRKIENNTKDAEQIGRIQDFVGGLGLKEYTDPVVENVVNFGQGAANIAERRMGQIGTMANGVLYDTNDPRFTKGTESNAFITNDEGEGTTVNKGVAQNAGGFAGRIIEQAPVFLASGGIGTAAEGAVAATKLGQMGSGVGWLTRNAANIAGQQIPISAANAIGNQGLTSEGLGGDLALGGLAAVLSTIVRKRITTNAIKEAGGLFGYVEKLTKNGQLDDAEKIINSAAYKAERTKFGLDNPENMREVMTEARSTFRNTAGELASKSKGIDITTPNSPNYINDNAVDTAMQFITHKVDDGRLNLKGAGNALDNIGAYIDDKAKAAEELAVAIGKNGANAGNNVDFAQFGQELKDLVKANGQITNPAAYENKIDQAIARMQELQKRGDSPFEILHSQRKGYNANYSNTRDTLDNFMGDAIRNKGKQMAEQSGDDTLKLYLEQNQKYADALGAQKLLKALHGSNIERKASQLLTHSAGYAASTLGGGLASPALYYAASKGVGKLMSKLSGKDLNKMIPDYIAKNNAKIADEANTIKKAVAKMADESAVFKGEEAARKFESNMQSWHDMHIADDVAKAEKSNAIKQSHIGLQTQQLEKKALAAQNADQTAADTAYYKNLYEKNLGKDITKNHQDFQVQEMTQKKSDNAYEKLKQQTLTKQSKDAVKSEFEAKKAALTGDKKLYANLADNWRNLVTKRQNASIETTKKIDKQLTGIEKQMKSLEDKGISFMSVVAAIGLGGAAMAGGTDSSMAATDTEQKVNEKVTSYTDSKLPIMKSSEGWYDSVKKIKPMSYEKYNTDINNAIKGTNITPELFKKMMMVESHLGESEATKYEKENIFASPIADLTGLEKNTWNDYKRRYKNTPKLDLNTVPGLFKATALVLQDKKNNDGPDGKMINQNDDFKTYELYTGQKFPAEKRMKNERFQLADDYYKNNKTVELPMSMMTKPTESLMSKLKNKFDNGNTYDASKNKLMSALRSM